MKKLILVATMCVALVSLLAAPVVMAAPGGKDNPANDNPQNLYLYEKDASWNIVWGGAWGKYNYSLSGTTITGPFNGHGLVPGTNYTLIYYPEPQTTWPWPVVTIGSGTADADGNVHIAGSANLNVSSGIKIWLVLTGDIVSGKLSGWNPTKYLFEHNLIP